MKKHVTTCLAAGLSVLAIGLPAWAAPEDRPITCLQTTRIKQTKAIDNETVLITMRGGKKYKMTLAHRCSGLKFHNTIIYESSIARLCEVDAIKVPISTSDFSQTTSCIIDSIDPISDEDAEALRQASK